jgi:hypothetical protein
VHVKDSAPWWRSAVIYQIYIRSFADQDGDGVGDIAGIRSRLPYLRDLGVDAVWITPWYPSPMVDAGYDVAGYTDIDPLFGTLPDAEALVREAHEHGLRVIIDIVPNHTSDRHPWFQAALAAGPGGPGRDRYVFRPGRGPGGDLPPNDWRSVFGGSAWTRVPDGEWYLHLFAAEQPDLDWENPVVRRDFEDVLAFWFDRGVDGFRIDVAHGLIKQNGLPDLGHDGEDVLEPTKRIDHPHWDRDGVHEIFREWRAVGRGPAAGGDRPDPDGARLGGLARDLGAVQPRRRTAPDEVRPAAHRGARAAPRRPGAARPGPRDAPRTRRRTPDARAARRGIRLPGGGTGTARGGGHPGRAPAGPGLGTFRAYRPGPGRLPGAAPVVRRRAAVRLRPGRQ